MTVDPNSRDQTEQEPTAPAAPFGGAGNWRGGPAVPARAGGSVVPKGAAAPNDRSSRDASPAPVGTRRDLRLPIAIAVLACLAGIGAASFNRRPQPVDGTQSPQVGATVRGISPRAVELTFNPRSSRGLKVAKAAFRIRYRCAAEQLEAVRDRIDSQWNVLFASSLRVFMRHTATELKSDEGLDKIFDELIRAIDDSVFNDGIASVESILLQQIIVQ